jgi:hypothetical protein
LEALALSGAKSKEYQEPPEAMGYNVPTDRPAAREGKEFLSPKTDETDLKPT